MKEKTKEKLKDVEKDIDEVLDDADVPKPSSLFPERSLGRHKHTLPHPHRHNEHHIPSRRDKRRSKIG